MQTMSDETMKRVLIAGATGHLGSFAVQGFLGLLSTQLGAPVTGFPFF